MNKFDSLYRPILDNPWFILRIWLGIAFIFHGLPGIFDNDYMSGHIALVELFNIPFPALAGYISKGGELLSGILLLLGLFTRVGAFIVILNMTIVTLFAMNGSIFTDFQAEISFTYLLIGLAIFLKGITRFSIDAMMAK